MHLALAASCYFAEACACELHRKRATWMMVRICGNYLWPASLPREPAVRRGVEGLTQVGSGVLRTSVFTSGSISEGEGVSLAPAMALLRLPERYLSGGRQAGRQAADTFPAPFAAVGAVRAHSGAPADQKKKQPRVPRLSCAAQGRRGSVWLPAASRAPQTH